MSLGSGRIPDFPSRAPQQARVVDLTLLTGFRWIVLAVVLTRSFLDPVFESLKAGGLDIGLGAALNALIIGIAFVFVVRRPKAMPGWAVLMWGPFLALCFVSIFYAPDVSAAVRLFLVILTYAAFFVLPFFILRYNSDLSRFIGIALASSIVPVAYGLFLTAIHISNPDFRLWSTFSHPNIFAFYLVLQVGLVLYAQVSTAVDWPLKVRRRLMLCLPLLLFLLVLTKTRSAWVATAIMIVVYAFWCDRRFLVLFVFLPVIFIGDFGIGDRLSDLRGGAGAAEIDQLNEDIRLNSLVWRTVLWSSAVPLMWSSPILGNGLDSFQLYSVDFFPLTIDGLGVYAHSLYVQTQFENGVLGVIALALLFVCLAVRLWRGLPYDRKGIIIIMGLVFTYLVESYSDNMIYYLAFNWYFFFVLGTVCAWIRVKQISQRVPADARSQRRAKLNVL